MPESETSDQLAKMLKRSFSAIKPITEHRLAPPSELARIIEKMMKMDLRSRYQNMEDVLKDILAFQSSFTGLPAEKAPEGRGQGASLVKKAEKARPVTGSIDDLFEAAFGYIPEPEGPKNLLCVEVQESIQDAFRKVFTKMGYEAKIVRDPEVALEMFRESIPDGLVFDADGLGGEAIETYLRIQETSHEAGRPLRALVLFGPRQAELAQKVVADDNVVVLHKPLKMKDVQDAITKLVPLE